MPGFGVRIQGAGCVVKINGVAKRRGFVTTRFVLANSEKDAGARAIAFVRKELAEFAVNDSSEHVLQDTECWLDRSAYIRRGSGFTWFPEKEP